MNKLTEYQQLVDGKSAPVITKLPLAHSKNTVQSSGKP